MPMYCTQCGFEISKNLAVLKKTGIVVRTEELVLQQKNVKSTSTLKESSFEAFATFFSNYFYEIAREEPYLAAFARTPEEVRGVRVSNLHLGEQAAVLENQIRHLMTAGEAR